MQGTNEIQVNQAVIVLSLRDNSVSATEEIAGVSLIRRAFIAISRAGINKFHILDYDSTESERLRIEKALQSQSCNWQWITTPANITDQAPVLLLSVSTLASPQSIRSICQNSENCIATDKANVYDIAKISPLALRDLDSKQKLLGYLQTIPALNVASFVHQVCDKKTAENALLHSLQAPLEGIVDLYFNRPLGRLMTLYFARLHTNPNFVSLFSIAIGMLTSLLFVSNDYYKTIWGAFLLQFSAVLDCIDGDIARIQFRESVLGRWLDIIGDNLVHIAVFLAIAVREYSIMPKIQILILGIMLISGAVISFFLVIYAQINLKSSSSNSLQRFINKITSRDFTVLLILGAIYGSLTWFLWLAAIGSQIFWLLVLMVHKRSL